MKKQRLWVIDDAVAVVDEGHVTLQISQPTRHLPREQAFNVADKIWFAHQMRQLEVARQKGETKEIPLTSRRKRSSIRMGGGFLITQGTTLIVPQRKPNAQRPSQLCLCGGVYEYMSDEPGDFDSKENDYVASLFKESQEIALLHLYELRYIPQLAPYSSNEIGFHPPETLEAYNGIMEAELKKELGNGKVLPKLPRRERKFWINVLDYEHAVRLEFAYSPALSVEITAEIDTSSLECFGVLSYPENIDEAAKAYLEEELDELEKQYREEIPREKRDKLEKIINELKKENEEIKKDIEEKKEIEYWDCELDWKPNAQTEEEKEPALHRNIHIIYTITRDVTVFERDVKVWEYDSASGKRNSRISTLGIELSKTKLGPYGTNGRLATEQLERAIKMHCPNSNLQPLITYY